jgi:hypothetical protein
MIEYMVEKPRPIQLSTGETIEAQVGQILSAEEVESWGEAAVRHMTGSGIIRAIPLVHSPRSPELVASAGSSMGVEGGSGQAAAPAANESEVEVEFHPGVVSESTTANASAGFPQHRGGGMYVLSDGSQVKGRHKAIAAEAALKA